MDDITKIALSDDQVYAAGKMRATLWTDPHTGKEYIHIGYWNGITEKHRWLLSEVLKVYGDRTEGTSNE